MTSAFGIDHGGFSKRRGEEFNPSAPYEKYSAEKKRRHIAVEAAGYGGASAITGAAGTGAAHAKFAGTRTGQGLLNAAGKKYGKLHPLHPHIQNAKKVGEFAAKHKGLMTAGVVAGSAISAGTGMAARFRHNEEQGISQGIGRIKAGNTYTGDQKRIRKRFTPFTTAATLADVDWNNPAIKGTLAFAHKYKKPLAAGAAGAAGGVGGTSLAVATHNRKRDAGVLRRRKS